MGSQVKAEATLEVYQPEQRAVAAFTLHLPQCTITEEIIRAAQDPDPDSEEERHTVSIRDYSAIVSSVRRERGAITHLTFRIDLREQLRPTGLRACKQRFLDSGWVTEYF